MNEVTLHGTWSVSISYWPERHCPQGHGGPFDFRKGSSAQAHVTCPTCNAEFVIRSPRRKKDGIG